LADLIPDLADILLDLADLVPVLADILSNLAYFPPTLFVLADSDPVLADILPDLAYFHMDLADSPSNTLFSWLLVIPSKQTSQSLRLTLIFIIIYMFIGDF